MNYYLNKIALLIRGKRKEKGYSTKELADKLGVSSGLINNIENCKTDTFNLELLEKLCKTLNMDVELLVSHDSIDLNSFNENSNFTNKIISNKYNNVVHNLQESLKYNSFENNLKLLDKLIIEINYFNDFNK